MSDQIMAIDVMNYPFTKEGMGKFWSSPEMKEMSQRVLGGKTPPGVPPDKFVAQMDEAGFDKVLISAVNMGSYRGKGKANDFTPESHNL